MSSNRAAPPYGQGQGQSSQPGFDIGNGEAGGGKQLPSLGSGSRVYNSSPQPQAAPASASAPQMPTLPQTGGFDWPSVLKMAAPSLQTADASAPMNWARARPSMPGLNRNVQALAGMGNAPYRWA